jgi:type VI secretion system secreted protein VgrG
MALPVATQIQIGDTPVTEFTNLTISQSLFGHHHFSLGIPYDRVEGTKGGFVSTAHEQLCGQRITITIGPLFPGGEGGAQAASFQFQGIVTELAVGSQGDLTGVFQVQGYSPTYLLDQAPVRRTFRNQTLLAIFQQVLKPYADELQPLQAKPQHTAPLPYVVQYDESDFTFLHRLAAQYGEWFYYDGTHLHLGKPTKPDLAFVSDGARAALNVTIALRHSAFVVSQYNLPQHKTLRADSAAQRVNWLGQNPLAAFALSKSEDLFTQAMQLPPGMVTANQTEVNEVAARFKSQHATSLVQASGWGEDPAMQLGGGLSVTGEGLGTEAATQESMGSYRITALVHTVDDADMYSNLFEAVPGSAEYPPLGPQRQAPLGQPELAEVIDQQDPERLGRLRVRYHWPVAKPSEAETVWVRVNTPYSGDGKGQMFTPELGSQVLVAYEHNRAEQPLVLGNLFHPHNKQGAKYSPPQNHLKGLQTAGGNKVVMSDKKGEQTILISNSNKKGTAVEIGFKGDGSITIKSQGPVKILSPDISLEAGDKGEIKLHAKNITIDAVENLKLLSGLKTEATTKEFDLKASQTLKAEGTTSAELAGTQVKVTGNATTDIKGGIVRIN